MVLFGLHFLYGMFYLKVWLWSCFPFDFFFVSMRGVGVLGVVGLLKVNSLLRVLRVWLVFIRVCVERWFLILFLEVA